MVNGFCFDKLFFVTGSYNDSSTIFILFLIGIFID